MNVDKEGEAKENLPLHRASSMHTLSDFVPGTSMPRQADGRTAFERGLYVREVLRDSLLV